MRFASPEHLYLAVLLPVLIGLYAYSFWKKRLTIAAFIDQTAAPRLLVGVSRARRWVKGTCLVGAVGCLTLALMQPQWGLEREEMPREGRDLMIVLDASLSMLAEDAPPNRLERSKAAIRDLVAAIREEGGTRLGLVVFAGRASLHCPLTTDYGFFLHRLDAVSPETVPRMGTDIGHAIRQTLRGFGDLEHAYTDVILVTDGEDHESFPLEAAKLAATSGVPLHTVGVGDASRAAPVYVPQADGRSTPLVYEGQAVHSRMRSRLLMEVARVTSGAFVLAATDEIDLVDLYDKKIAPKERRRLESDAQERLGHRYYWFVLGALLLLMVEMLLAERAHS